MPNREQTKPNSMRVFLFVAILSLLLASCSRTVYVVRHAEKITSTDSAKMMADDPALSDAGKVRALVLKDELAGKHIRHIYSTSTIRTRSTAEPLSQAIKINIEIYKSIDSLVNIIKSVKGNVLVVGHSNTVDDIVNKLCGQVKIVTDLKDGEYDNLFVVKIRGKKVIVDRRKYGYPSNP
jgi:2,3-bisphosphoglycerate-dependent phosphoglycerate mutase